MQDEQETEKTWLNPPVCSARFFLPFFFYFTGFLAHSHTSFLILNFSSKFFFLISHLFLPLPLPLILSYYALDNTHNEVGGANTSHCPRSAFFYFFFVKMFPIFFPPADLLEGVSTKKKNSSLCLLYNKTGCDFQIFFFSSSSLVCLLSRSLIRCRRGQTRLMVTRSPTCLACRWSDRLSSFPATSPRTMWCSAQWWWPTGPTLPRRGEDDDNGFYTLHPGMLTRWMLVLSWKCHLSNDYQNLILNL